MRDNCKLKVLAECFWITAHISNFISDSSRSGVVLINHQAEFSQWVGITIVILSVLQARMKQMQLNKFSWIQKNKTKQELSHWNVRFSLDKRFTETSTTCFRQAAGCSHLQMSEQERQDKQMKDQDINSMLHLYCFSCDDRKLNRSVFN